MVFIDLLEHEDLRLQHVNLLVRLLDVCLELFHLCLPQLLRIVRFLDTDEALLYLLIDSQRLL